VNHEQLLTIRQVADRLQVPELSVREMLERGELRGIHHGKLPTGWRVSEGSLRRFIDSRETKAEGK